MKIPVMRGIIDRRILVNYHVDPNVLAPLLPAPFRPKVIHGVGMVGICLIRLKNVRPRFVPAWLGISSENAAHRTAVEWDDNGAVREGVYIRRRDTNSWLNSLGGGRLFPGIHNHARFTVQESADRFEVALQSDDGVTSMSVRSHRVDHLPASSVFQSPEEASAFFKAGSLGYSATAEPTRFHGLELHCPDWRIELLEVEEVRSSFFEDVSLFPRGSIEFDCALMMRGIEHEWHGKADLCCAAARPSEALQISSQLPHRKIPPKRIGGRNEHTSDRADLTAFAASRSFYSKIALAIGDTLYNAGAIPWSCVRRTLAYRPKSTAKHWRNPMS